ncbi:MAG: hybrid sensor histidine kinase/response regulator [Thermodesulfovibrionales bacterium]
MGHLADNIEAVMDFISDGILIIDRDHFIVFANKAMLDICGGLRTADFIGKKCHEIFHRCPTPCPQACLAEIVCPYDEVFRGEKTATTTHRHRMPDNTERTFSITASPIRDKTGTVTGMVETLRDITEQTKTEDALQKSETFMKNIFESVDEAFIVIDPGFRIIAANRAYCKQVKSPSCDIIGSYCYEVSHHQDKPCFDTGEECAPLRSFRTGEPALAVHTHFDSEGKPVYIEARSHPIKDDAGAVTAVIETLNNITEMRKMEDQLRHAQKMEAIGILAGGIAHDFNNILNVIIGFGTMALDRQDDDNIAREQINEVLAAADRAVTLTKRLLVFSRKQVVEITPVNVNEIILGMEKMVARIIGEDIVFTMELADLKMTVMADAGQIEQVLMNLVANAHHAMPKGGRLTISTGIMEVDETYIRAQGYGKTGTYAQISVADTGSGMDAGTQQKIFEPFFTTKGIGEGTGLGLAIAYGIVKQHDGYIKVYSQEGKGTTFKILLPVVGDKETKRPDNGVASPTQGGTETILVAEDDAALRKLTQVVLESFGYTVITAEDGAEAIARYRENKDNIRLLVFDVLMPKKNGREAYEEIRKISPDIRALFLSGYAADVITRKELLDGDMDFIRKPVSTRDFLKKVREALDK